MLFFWGGGNHKRKKKYTFLKIKKKAKHKLHLTTSKRAVWEMYGLGTKGGHFHYEQEAAYILRKWERPMTVQCVNTEKTEVKGGKMITFVNRKLQNSVNQNA
jgi:hypothetical protein